MRTRRRHLASIQEATAASRWSGCQWWPRAWEHELWLQPEARRPGRQVGVEATLRQSRCIRIRSREMGSSGGVSADGVLGSLGRRHVGRNRGSGSKSARRHHTLQCRRATRRQVEAGPAAQSREGQGRWCGGVAKTKPAPRPQENRGTARGRARGNVSSGQRTAGKGSREGESAGGRDGGGSGGSQVGSRVRVFYALIPYWSNLLSIPIDLKANI